MTDERLLAFITDTRKHELVVEHLISKGVPLSQANLFFQPETWEQLGEWIENGVYHFSPTIEGYVDKKTGNGLTYEQASARNFEDVRKIYMMTPIDRAVAHMVYLIYYGEFIDETDEHCVSYKKTIGTPKIIKALSREMNSRNWFDGWKLDIRKYFDSVSLPTIEKILKHMSKGSALDRILWEMYHDDRVIINGDEVEKYKSLIQGCAFACLMANLVLTDVDKAVRKLNVIYYRYSDDIIVLGKDADLALKLIEHMIKGKGLVIHPEKKQPIHGNDQWFEFLGFKLKGNKITVAEKTLKNICREVRRCTVNQIHNWKRPATKTEVKRMIRDLQKYFYTAYAKDSKKFGMGSYLFGAVNVGHDINEIECYMKDCLRACYTGKVKGLYSIGSATTRKDGSAKEYGITHGNGEGRKLAWLAGEDVSQKQSCPVAENRRKTQNDSFVGGDLLKELGWISTVHMWKAYHNGKDVFDYEVMRMF